MTYAANCAMFATSTHRGTLYGVPVLQFDSPPARPLCVDTTRESERRHLYLAESKDPDVIEVEKLKRELMAIPEVQIATREAIRETAEKVLKGIVKLTLQCELLDDELKARRILENMMWAIAEANQEAAKQRVSADRPKPALRGQRGGVT